MFERFSRSARNVVIAAQTAAARRADPRIGTEHLLIGLAEIDNPVMAGFGLTPAGLRRLLGQMDVAALGAVGVDIDADVLPELPLHRRRRWWRRSGGRGHIPFTAGAKDALNRALRIAVDHGHRHIGDEHILAALVIAGVGDPAARLLRVAGVDPGQLDAYVRQFLDRNAP